MADVVSGFNVVARLGDGARSQILQVVRPETGEVFALKRVIRQSHEDARFLDQAVNEYDVATRVDHPALRKVYELRRIRKLFKVVEVQVVMEYIDGVSLDRTRPKEVSRIVEVFTQVADALRSMHECGFVHADIKPNNIMIAYDGSVRIIDLGQCCPIGFKKPRIQGTPDYIAPEQVERLPLTQQTDVYNLGATLYWALTGRNFPTVMSKAGKKAEGRAGAAAPTPESLNPEVPAALSRLVMHCCEHNRVDRPKTMSAVIKALELAMPSMPKSAGADPARSTPDAPRGDVRRKEPS